MKASKHDPATSWTYVSCVCSGLYRILDNFSGPQLIQYYPHLTETRMPEKVDMLL